MVAIARTRAGADFGKDAVADLEAKYRFIDEGVVSGAVSHLSKQGIFLASVFRLIGMASFKKDKKGRETLKLINSTPCFNEAQTLAIALSAFMREERLKARLSASHFKKVLAPPQRREMAQWAVQDKAVSIRVAC
jgi:hypothetical protein